MRSFQYLTRLPPSPSGVALYAEMFAQVLQIVGDVEVIRLPPLAEDSQSVRTAGAVLRAVERARRRNPEAILFVELAGRGVAEFWAAWWAARHGRPVVVTMHDAPAVSGGGPFFTRLLDRRGGRRLAAGLSAGIGRRAERSLLSRALAVIALSDAGARSVERAYLLDRVVSVLPHVMTLRDGASLDDAAQDHGSGVELAQRRVIYVPGHVSAPGDATPALTALTVAGPDWSAVVGACSRETEAAIHDEASALGVDDRVILAGLTDEASLDETYGRAAIVLRWRAAGFAAPGAPGSAAVSGPLVRAMGRGCAVVTNDNRGSAGCLVDAGARVVGNDPDETTQAVVDLVENPGEREHLARQALNHVRRVHVPSVVADELTQILDGARPEALR